MSAIPAYFVRGAEHGYNAATIRVHCMRTQREWTGVYPNPPGRGDIFWELSSEAAWPTVAKWAESIGAPEWVVRYVRG